MRTIIPIDSKIKLNLDNKRVIRTLYLIVIIQIILSIFYFGFIGVALASERGNSIILNVEPSLPSSVLNDGLGQVTISWLINYANYKLDYYQITIIAPNKNVLYSVRTKLNDSNAGEHSPISGMRKWNVQKGGVVGIYFVLLEIKYEEIPLINAFSQFFVVANDQGTLIISKFEDINGNGQMDQGEKMLSGWHFRIRYSSNESNEFTNDIECTTGENGTATMSHIPAGLYRIEEEQRLEYTPTTQKIQYAYLQNNSTTAVMFGNQFAGYNEAINSSDDELITKPLNGFGDYRETATILAGLVTVLAVFLSVFTYLRSRGRRNE